MGGEVVGGEVQTRHRGGEGGEGGAAAPTAHVGKRKEDREERGRGGRPDGEWTGRGVKGTRRLWLRDTFLDLLSCEAGKGHPPSSGLPPRRRDGGSGGARLARGGGARRRPRDQQLTQAGLWGRGRSQPARTVRRTDTLATWTGRGEVEKGGAQIASTYYNSALITVNLCIASK